MDTIDLSIMKYYKDGNVLCGFEGVHEGLYKNGYLDGDLELTKKGRAFISTFSNWDDVISYNNKMYITIKPKIEIN